MSFRILSFIFFCIFAVSNDFTTMTNEFFRKIFKYIVDADIGEMRCRMLVVLGVVILVGGLLTSRIPVREALLFGLFAIVAGILAEYVGKSVRRKIRRKKELEDLKRFQRFKYEK